jgi:hypothetical protein
MVPEWTSAATAGQMMRHFSSGSMKFNFDIKKEIKLFYITSIKQRYDKQEFPSPVY